MVTKVKKLRVISYPSGYVQWLSLYKCECGNEIERLEQSVKRSKDPHCGCKTTSRSDLQYGSELDSRRRGILIRVANGYNRIRGKYSKCYENVKICDEWKNDFHSFYNWAISTGFKPHLHIDRIDSNKNYTPDNCRWVTQQENNRNGARSKLTPIEVREILHLHGTHPSISIAELYEVTPSIITNIAKGNIWKDIHELYATDKNLQRCHPSKLTPLPTNITKGKIIMNTIIKAFTFDKTIEFTVPKDEYYKDKKKVSREILRKLRTSDKLKPLEVSTKSDTTIGFNLSAFNLKINIDNKISSFESFYQGSKVFENGGPYTDLYSVSSLTAKIDKRLKNSGKVIGYETYDGKQLSEPNTLFYNYFYIKSVIESNEINLKELLTYNVFIDIEFNSETGINCQAKACCVLVDLYTRGLLDEAMRSIDTFKRIVYIESNYV